jgi:site-specific DNA-methyltransferase (cytosine-N4-specific)
MFKMVKLATTLLSEVRPAYETRLGAAYCGDARELLKNLPDGSINLVITSPPFALQRAKEYGNASQSEYCDWLIQFAEIVYRKLRQDGSFVLDLGGAYEKGVPIRSLYNFRLLIRLCDELGFFLAEDFYWYNPSKLPSPIEWVNKRKIRAKDSVDTVWWLAKSEWPKADISSVLTEYSPRMQKLLQNPGKFYSAKRRPSGHDISMGFGKDNGGAIPSNLLQIPNTDSNGQYLRGCKQVGVAQHPARFPEKLPQFFVRLLTGPGDLVVDIFAGSNTTGYVAETEGRAWLAFEERMEYVAASSFRFLADDASDDELRNSYSNIMQRQPVDLSTFAFQPRLLEQKARYEDTSDTLQDLDRKHMEGYQKYPQVDDEFDAWTNAQLEGGM